VVGAGDCPPGVVAAVFGMGWRRLPGVVGAGDCPPGVVAAVFGMGWRRPPGDVTAGGCPPGTVVAKLFLGGSATGLPSVVAPVSAAAWIAGGGGGAGSGAFSAPLLTRVTTALGNAALTGTALPPSR
jgi:hypothetical protein